MARCGFGHKLVPVRRVELIAAGGRLNMVMIIDKKPVPVNLKPDPMAVLVDHGDEWCLNCEAEVKREGSKT